MTLKAIHQILRDTDYVHTGGSAEELHVAEYLRARAEALGAEARLEAFPVAMSTMRAASLTADGRAVPCEGYRCCGSGEIEAPLCYLPNTDPASLTKVKGKIVLLDSGLRYFVYHDLLDNGALGFITYDGNVNFRDNDIDERELRGYVATGRKALSVNVNAKEALKLVKDGVKTVRIAVSQDEYEGESHNVIAELPGATDEWIALTAHYDTVPLSRGSYDNMSGCIGLMEILEAMKAGAPHRYGLRFVFCGSEERGLLGSKAYVQAHEAELNKIVLNINLDMIGSIMGRFIACVSAEEALAGYIRYFAAQRGWGIDVRTGVYSSDSTPFADKGVPAVSFARLAPPTQSNIHSRYDTMALLSEEQLRQDSGFAAAFTAGMADAVKCPVKREIPEKIRGELDEYLNRKRKD
ncbi:MAG: Zn-dependent exopeptidase M28 [Clostridia bacterium]|nr:Zn-dependent exopeptidase M28 [Clostridia bacterium]